jgi:hypothetical protein
MLHPARAAYQTTIAADYSGNTGAIDKVKPLNVARGGHGINSDLTWMPSFYDKLAEVGVREFRIDWLLSDGFYSVVSRNGSGQLVYDFSRLDQVILPLAQRGIKPDHVYDLHGFRAGSFQWRAEQLRGIPGDRPRLRPPLSLSRLFRVELGIA